MGYKLHGVAMRVGATPTNIYISQQLQRHRFVEGQWHGQVQKKYDLACAIFMMVTRDLQSNITE